jgi:hypothetical protein
VTEYQVRVRYLYGVRSTTTTTTTTTSSSTNTITNGAEKYLFLSYTEYSGIALPYAVPGSYRGVEYLVPGTRRECVLVRFLLMREPSAKTQIKELVPGQADAFEVVSFFEVFLPQILLKQELGDTYLLASSGPYFPDRECTASYFGCQICLAGDVSCSC